MSSRMPHARDMSPISNRHLGGSIRNVSPNFGTPCRECRKITTNRSLICNSCVQTQSFRWFYMITMMKHTLLINHWQWLQLWKGRQLMMLYPWDCFDFIPELYDGYLDGWWTKIWIGRLGRVMGNWIVFTTLALMVVWYSTSIIFWVVSVLSSSETISRLCSNYHYTIFVNIVLYGLGFGEVVDIEIATILNWMLCFKSIDTVKGCRIEISRGCFCGACFPLLVVQQ